MKYFYIQLTLWTSWVMFDVCQIALEVYTKRFGFVAVWALLLSSAIFQVVIHAREIIKEKEKKKQKKDDGLIGKPPQYCNN